MPKLIGIRGFVSNPQIAENPTYRALLQSANDIMKPRWFQNDLPTLFYSPTKPFQPCLGFYTIFYYFMKK